MGRERAARFFLISNLDPADNRGGGVWAARPAVMARARAARFFLIFKLDPADNRGGGVWAARPVLMGRAPAARFFLITKLDPADNRFGVVCHGGVGRGGSRSGGPSSILPVLRCLLLWY